MTRLLKYPHALSVPYTAKDIVHFLIKQSVEAILNEELQEHLDQEKKEDQGISGNSRNGSLKKTVATSLGTIAIRVPRDRKGTFKPRIIRAYAKDITGKDQSLIALYEEGLPQILLERSSRELYSDQRYRPSTTLIKRIGAFFKQWQQKRYDPLYLSLSYEQILYRAFLDDISVTKKGYLCSGTDSYGHTNPLGLWTVKPDDDHFWRTLFLSLKAKGVADVLVVYRNGLPSFQELIAHIFARTPFQQYVIRLIHEALPSIPQNLHHAFLVKMKKLYLAINKTEVRAAFKHLRLSWGPQSPFDSSPWLSRWEQENPSF